jgi:transcriptional regulator with XRE-family HTH domain
VARKAAGLSQRQLAAALGVSVRTIQNYERGRSVPFRHLPTLETLLGRSSAWLLYGREDTESDDLLSDLRAQRALLEEILAHQRELLAELRGGVHEGETS